MTTQRTTTQRAPEWTRVTEQSQANGTEVATTKSAVAIGRPMGGIDEMWRMAKALAGSNLLRAALRGKQNDILVTVLYGQELGLAPMQAIQGIYVVNGRPSLAGQTWLSLARRAGHRVQVMEHTAETCTVKVTRGDDGTEHTETFTWAEAEKAKLTNKDVWKSWPKRMLMWRAVSNACTFICPEIALGFEVQGAEFEPETASQSLGQVAAERVTSERADRADRADRAPAVVDAETVDDAAVRDQVLSIQAELADDGAAQELPGYGWPTVREPGAPA